MYLVYGAVDHNALHNTSTHQSTTHNHAQHSHTGLDSLGAVELSHALASHFSTSLSPTFVFDYPTVTAMAHHLRATLYPAEAVVGGAQHTPAIPSPRAMPGMLSSAQPGALAVLAVSHQPTINMPLYSKAHGPVDVDAVGVVPCSRYEIQGGGVFG